MILRSYELSVMEPLKTSRSDTCHIGGNIDDTSFSALLLDSDEELDASTIIPENAAVVRTGTCNDLTSRLGALLLDSDDESASDDGDSEDKENAVPDDPDWSFRVDSLSPFIFEPPPISPLDDMDVGPPIRPVEFYRLFLNDRLVNA
ncbi:hypothetical protein OSTOST_18306, partial [Ostertagia ostertagi]